MPLTCKKFLGFPILLQPPYATNLGVYSVNVISRDVVKEYIDQMISRYFYIDINLNKYNRLTSLFFKPRHDSIFELDLIPNYQRIHAAYSSKISGRIIQSSANKLSILAGMNSNDLIKLHLENKSWIWKFLFKRKVDKLKMLISTAIKYRVGQIYGAYTRENTLCGAALFVWSHQKVFLLFFGLTSIGINEYALETIIDEFIKLHAEQNITLRFEYTHRKKYADIYMGFGGRKFEFTRIKRFNLRWLN